MGGFPTRASRAAYGPTFQNRFAVRDPAHEPGADMVNLLAWQAGGLAQVTPKIVLTCSVAAAAVSAPEFYGLTFDSTGALVPISFTYEAAGRYSFAFDETYDDEKGVAQNLALIGGAAIPIQRNVAIGQHDGGDNQSVLGDSGESWDTDEFVGDVIYNLTDGSKGIVTANTSNTITATLTGGTDNDWDDNDEYIVVRSACRGWVHLTSGYAGEVYFCRYENTLVDPAEFLLMLW